MKRILFASCLLFAAGAARAEVPALLDEAIRKWIADEDHWAYNQHLLYKNGRDSEDRLERYDPSLPEDRQWTLLEVNGKKPTADQIKAWKPKKEREVKRRTRQPMANYFDLDHARVVGETVTSVRYDVPMRKESYRRVPLDKIVVSMTVNKQHHDLEALTAGLREQFRVALGAAKVTDLAIDIQFRSIDPKYASQPFSIKANGSAKVALFFRIGGNVDVGWSDFKRVEPLKSRFQVEIGDLKALNFPGLP